MFLYKWIAKTERYISQVIAHMFEDSYFLDIANLCINKVGFDKIETILT